MIALSLLFLAIELLIGSIRHLLKKCLHRYSVTVTPHAASGTLDHISSCLRVVAALRSCILVFAISSATSICIDATFDNGRFAGTASVPAALVDKYC